MNFCGYCVSPIIIIAQNKSAHSCTLVLRRFACTVPASIARRLLIWSALCLGIGVIFYLHSWPAGTRLYVHVQSGTVHQGAGACTFILRDNYEWEAITTKMCNNIIISAFFLGKTFAL